MRQGFAALALLAGLAGCGGDGAASAEEVVRAWSAALNADRNGAAADLFAPGATVVQGDVELRLDGHAEAVAWNEALPCNGQIVALDADDDVVTATFLLRDSQTTPCDGPGQRATAIFTVRDGEIVRWEQPAAAPGPTI